MELVVEKIDRTQKQYNYWTAALKAIVKKNQAVCRKRSVEDQLRHNNHLVE
jgi:hypothetical protein